MPAEQHIAIIGNGVAGNQAADLIRRRDKDCRITIVSAGALLFYNRYELPDVFRGRQDWREYLVHTPEYYDDNRIVVRRKSLVSDIDAANRTLHLAHREEVSYDQLLVATGGAAYLPEQLRDSLPHMHSFATYRDAMVVHAALPKGGRLVLLGGDMIGLDLGRTLVATGYRVTVIPSERSFWPHEIDADEQPRYLSALETMGFEVVPPARVEGIEAAGKGRRKGAKRVLLEGGKSLVADVVMPAYGIVPSVDFMSASGVDIERGLLVSPQLQTTRPEIWASGDVCQIWSEAHNDYRFYYGWKNVKKMGEVAARNMMGDNTPFKSRVDESLKITKKGGIHSPFWEYQ